MLGKKWTYVQYASDQNVESDTLQRERERERENTDA